MGGLACGRSALASGVRHAQPRRHALLRQGVAARDVVRYKRAAEVLLHAPVVLAAAARSEVEQHRRPFCLVREEAMFLTARTTSVVCAVHLHAG